MITESAINRFERISMAAAFLPGETQRERLIRAVQLNLPRLSQVLRFGDDHSSGIVVCRFLGDIDYPRLQSAGLEVVYASPVVSGLVYCRTVSRVSPDRVTELFRGRVHYIYPETLFASRPTYKSTGEKLVCSQWHHTWLSAGTASTGAGVTIAVIDYTFNLGVKNLSAAGGAYWTSTSCELTLPFPATNDDHGTQCASLAVGRAVANCGVGIAPAAGFLAFAIRDNHDKDGQSRMARAIQMAIAPPTGTAWPTANIISISVAPGEDRSGNVPMCKDLEDALDAAKSANVLVIWAVANDSKVARVANDLPANHAAVLPVGSVNQQSAYEGATMPAMVVGVTDTCAVDSRGGLSSVGAGNSFAPPLIAGAAALIWSANSSLKACQVKDALLASGVNVNLTGCDGKVYSVPIAQVAGSAAHAATLKSIAACP